MADVHYDRLEAALDKRDVEITNELAALRAKQVRLRDLRGRVKRAAKALDDYSWGRGAYAKDNPARDTNSDDLMRTTEALERTLRELGVLAEHSSITT